jgi:alpha-L-rhamnosidase
VLKEDWTGGLVQMPSLQGPIGTWFYHSLAGIRQDPSAPGFKHVIIKPEIENTLTWVKAYHDSLYGRIASEWRHDGGSLTLNVTIPPNTTATVYVPAELREEVTEGGKPVMESPGVDFLRMKDGRAVLSVGSGSYQFASKVKQVPIPGRLNP